MSVTMMMAACEDFSPTQFAFVAKVIEQTFVDGKAEALSWVLRDRNASPTMLQGTSKLDTLEQSIEHERNLFWRYTAWCFAHNVATACAIEAAIEGRLAESQPPTYRPISDGEWAIEFRNGMYFQTLEAQRGGPYETAWRFPSKEAADKFMIRYDWIAFSGGMAKKG